MIAKNYARLSRIIVFLAATLCFITVLQSGAEAQPRSSASVAAGAVSGVSAGTSTAAAGVSAVTFTVQFTTSPTGTLEANAGTVTVSAPGAKLPDCADLTDLTDGASSLACTAGGLPPGPEMTLTVRQDIPGGHRVQVVFRDATNPAATGSHALTVSTSSDTAAATSYTTVAAGAVSGVSAGLSTAAAGASGVIFTVQFTTSATGGLKSEGGTVTVSAPGAKLPDCADLTDLTDGASSLACTAGGLPPGPEMTLTVRQDIPGGHRVQVVFRDATNPAATGSHALTVSTSSDTAAATSYTTVAAGAVSGVSAGLSTAAAGASGVIFTVQFTTSATGGLKSEGGTVTVSAPGAKLPDCADLTDLTDGASSLACTAGGLPPGPEMTLTVRQDIPGGHRVQVVFRDATNPAATGSHALTVSTSSDTAAATSYTTVAAGAVSGEVVSPNGQPIPAAEVQACSTSPNVCFHGSTNEAGRFLVPVEVGRAYHVIARGSVPGEPLATASLADAVEVPTATVVTGLVITISVFPMPAGVTVGGQSGGIPTLNWSTPTPITVKGCPNGIGLAQLTAVDSSTGQTATYAGWLNESPRGSGNYSGTLPPTEPAHGEATIKTAFYCLTALFPKAGPSAGGTTVHIHGSNFTSATSVKFGSTPASSFKVVSDSEIDAVAPPGTGTVHVSVTTPAGTTQATSANQYSYFSISSVSPAKGPANGNTRVVIHGVGLNSVDLVAFGRTAVDWTPVSDTEIDAVMPPGTGTVAVAAAALGEDANALGFGSLQFAYQGSPSSAAATGNRGSALHSISGPVGISTQAALAHSEDSAPCAGTLCAVGQPLSEGGPVTSDWTLDDIKFVAGEFVAALELYAFALGPHGIFFAATFGELILPALALVAAGAFLTFMLKHALDKAYAGYGFHAYIDPSGTVINTRGSPIAGATVTMLRGPTALGPFAALDAKDPAIQPSINPEVTGSDGAFHWDVLSGYYQLTASAPGCTAPEDPARSTATSPVLPVPPPQVGLLLTLACPNEPPLPLPKVASMTATDGPAVGGNTVFIYGSGFTPSATVLFGDATAKSVTFLSPQALSVNAPAGSGTVDVTVSTSARTSATSAAGRYTYHQAPSVTGVTPNQGSTKGGDAITITGTGFSAATGVLFGAAPAAFTVTSDTQITARVPAQSAGTVDVTVQSLYGTSAIGASDRFTGLGASPPGMPANVHVTPGDKRITVSWAAPADNGTAVDGYRVAATRVGGGAPVTRDSASSPLDLTGLTNGTSYDVTVAAHNAAGWGPPSPATRVTLAASVPVTAYPLVRRGDISLSGVRTVQFLLRSNPSPRFAIAADGIFGPRTEAAVRLFQTVNGLVTDGIVGQATWRKLVLTQRYGSRGEQVRAIQALLNIYGRAHAGYRLAEDGMFGPSTRAAVIRFQRAANITDDGVVGPVTWPFLVHEAMRAEAAD